MDETTSLEQRTFWESFAASITGQTAANINKIIEPYLLDIGEVVSICSSIRGLDPRSLDIVLALDVSGSMSNTAGGGMTRLETAQVAAITFVNLLSSTDWIAVVPYSDTAFLAQPLTTTKSAVTQAIVSLTAIGYSNIGEGIRVSHQELITSSPRYVSDTIKAIILLSDGTANLPVDEATAKEYARQRAGAASSDNVRIYTIGFGNEADQGLLQEIANTSGREVKGYRR